MGTSKFAKKASNPNQVAQIQGLINSFKIIANFFAKTFIYFVPNFKMYQFSSLQEILEIYFHFIHNHKENQHLKS